MRFRPGKTTIKKRSEHGLESWVLFPHLVIAFDRVPRELSWMILTKCGVPKKLVGLLRALHGFKVRLTVNDVIGTIGSDIGVKQGDILGPILFTFLLRQ